MTITNKRMVKACNDSLKHWRRMARWAAKQDGLAIMDDMYAALEERTGQEDCALCQLFGGAGCSMEDQICPLNAIDECCCECGSAYGGTTEKVAETREDTFIDRAITWKQFAELAKDRMIPAIEAAREYARKHKCSRW